MKNGMHWADILAELHKAGSSPSEIAREEQVSPAIVTNVVRGERTSHRVAYAIAAKTGIPTERMWPGKYLTPPAYAEARGDSNCGRLREVVNG